MRTFFFLLSLFLFCPSSYAQSDSPPDKEVFEERKKRPIRLSEQIEVLSSLSDKNVEGEALVKKAEKTVQYFRAMDKKKVIPELKEKIEKTPFKGLFEKFPLSYQFLAEVFTHKKALPQLFKLSLKKNLLIFYGLFFLFTIYLGFYLKNKRTEDESFIGSFLKRVAILFTLRVGLFFALFYEEVTPTLSLFLKIVL
jgi:hypothetical protein